MADPKRLALLKQSVDAWNAERRRFRFFWDHADHSEGYLEIKVVFTSVDLRGADLSKADLTSADLSHADLTGVNFNRSKLREVNFSGADLTGADLSGANLHSANFTDAILSGANLTKSLMLETVLANTNLSQAKGLGTCRHMGPSIIDHRTIHLSGQLPQDFLRYCGLPDPLIELLTQSIEFYSCYISYSSRMTSSHGVSTKTYRTTASAAGSHPRT